MCVYVWVCVFQYVCDYCYLLCSSYQYLSTFLNNTLLLNFYLFHFRLLSLPSDQNDCLIFIHNYQDMEEVSFGTNLHHDGHTLLCG